MSNAIGNMSAGGGGGSSTALSSGQNVYDVSKYGALPDPGHSNSLKGAIDTISGLVGSGDPVTIYIPSGTYTIFDSIWLPSNLCSVVGQDMQTTVINGFGLPAFIVGFPKEYGNQPITAGHWPAMPTAPGVTNGMDSAWANGIIGNRKGFAMYDPATGLTNPDLRYFYFQNTPITQGLTNDYWTVTNKFTLELAALHRTASPTASVPAIGPGLPPLGYGVCLANFTSPSMTRPWSVLAQGIQGNVVSSAANSVTITKTSSVLGINGGNIPVGSLIQVTTGTGAGQINQITSITPSGGNLIFAVQNSWNVNPGAGATVVVLCGFSISVNIATTPLCDGQIPGYDPSQDGTQSGIGLMFPTGMGAQLSALTSANSIWRFKFQLDLTASSLANLAQGWVSINGSASGSFAQMTAVSGPALPLPNPHFVEASFGFVSVGAPILQPQLQIFPGYSMVPFVSWNGGVTPTFTADQKAALPGWDVTLLGMSLVAGNSGGNVYTTAATLALNTSGPRPTGTIGDNFSYGPSGVANMLAWLPFSDPGLTDSFGGRMAAITPLGGSGTRGIVLPMIYLGDNSTPIGNQCSVSNLTVSGSSNPSVGMAFWAGPCYDMHFDNIYVNSFQNGICQVPFNNGYILDVSFLGTKSCADAGMFLFNTYGRIKNYHTTSQRTGLRCVSATLEVGTWINGNVVAGLHTARGHTGEYSSSCLFMESFINDNEAQFGTPAASIAIIDYDNGPTNSVTALRLPNLNLSSPSGIAPYIKLRNIVPAGCSTLRLTGPACSPKGAPLVQMVGGNTGWDGVIEDVNFNTVSPDFDYTPILDCTFGPRTSRIRLEIYLDGLPIAGPWAAGATVIKIRASALLPGMPTSFVCVQGGQYGTNSPPVWDARDPYSPDGTNNAIWMTTTRTNYGSCTITGL